MAYIDREEFRRKLIDEKSFFPAIVARALEEMPAADVVEVVRCKDCEYFYKAKSEENTYYCFVGMEALPTKIDGFCNYGKRRSE